MVPIKPTATLPGRLSFKQLLLVYGIDYGLLTNYFPGCSRQQIKKQLSHLENTRGKDLDTEL